MKPAASRVRSNFIDIIVPETSGKITFATPAGSRYLNKVEASICCSRLYSIQTILIFLRLNGFSNCQWSEFVISITRNYKCKNDLVSGMLETWSIKEESKNYESSLIRMHKLDHWTRQASKLVEKSSCWEWRTRIQSHIVLRRKKWGYVSLAGLTGYLSRLRSCKTQKIRGRARGKERDIVKLWPGNLCERSLGGGNKPKEEAWITREKEDRAASSFSLA